ncbi:MAG: hypothetical protein IKZ19_02630, partial [Clostridia bacterium]|nr:hypothetical protein [Clostridia bacterium]
MISVNVTAEKFEDARSDGFAVWYSRSYDHKDGFCMTERKRLQCESDYSNGFSVRRSADNGRTWGPWEDMIGESVKSYGAHERMLPESDMSEVHGQWNPVHGHSVSIAMDRVFRNGHKAAYETFWGSNSEPAFSDHTYLSVKTPDGTVKTQLVTYEEGTEFDPEDPVAPSYFKQNICYRGMNVVVDGNGDILFPVCPTVSKCCGLAGMDTAEVFPSCPDIMHGILMIRGVWNGEKYEFIPS